MKNSYINLYNDKINEFISYIVFRFHIALHSHLMHRSKIILILTVDELFYSMKFIESLRDPFVLTLIALKLSG